MTVATPGRPLVTFALFAYNQEQYVREAVEAALSQTYSPLEIILSDDCSSDRTFEIMEEMAREYRGPHQIKIRRGEKNIGLLAHVLTVAQIAKGEIFVVAAGDDISLPSRSARIVQALSGTEYLAFSSDDTIIDENGVERDWDKERFDRRRSWHSANQAWLHGATAAYTTEFLKELPIPDVPIFYEDMVFIDLINIFGGRSFRSNDNLLKYRHHSRNLSNRSQITSSIGEIEEQTVLRWRRERDAKKYCIDCIKETSGRCWINNEITERIDLEHAYLSRIADWRTAKPIDRLELLFFAIHTGNAKSALPRIFGERVFFFLKRFRSV
ncbi:glycosyltransferase [Shimia aestuarii]|uniref:glycosyltransferase n=1 Tax=Shimia aestuarii TaxID=254406 RepID=UPI001FB21D46|nr:glycosyltransferase [Shimia aestuarii]